MDTRESVGIGDVEAQAEKAMANIDMLLREAGSELGDIVKVVVGAVPRGDGLLTHEVYPGEKGPQDACGVFGVWAPGEEVAKLTFFGLYALQHRGQESAGIAVSDGHNITVYKDMGLVSQVFTESSLESLQGHIAIGHTRYSTTGSSCWDNAQPTFRATASGHLALSHNGNLTNTHDLASRLRSLQPNAVEVGPISGMNATTDTDILTALLAAHPDITNEAAALDELPRVRGAFSLVFMDDQTLYGARDPQGIRPLVLGRLERGWVLASETCALDLMEARVERDIEPGEMLIVDERGLTSLRPFRPADRLQCVFEYVYFARPDSTISGASVYEVRKELGRQLARECPADAEIGRAHV